MSAVSVSDTLSPSVAVAPRLDPSEEHAFRYDQITSMLRDFPIGLMVITWDLVPLWYNDEAALACAVWNHGERMAAVLNSKRTFQLPPALLKACSDLRRTWEATRTETRSPMAPVSLSHPTLGLHAQLSVGRGISDVHRLAFQVKVDYRRDRGDRHRPVSPGALALLARLSTREREVAMKVREGQRTAEIAKEFRRSPLTIKTQLNSVFSKLGVRNRTQVAALLNR